MKIHIRESRRETGKTFISPNLIKESVTLDKNGNEIDRKTKQIIKKNEEKE